MIKNYLILVLLTLLTGLWYLQNHLLLLLLLLMERLKVMAILGKPDVSSSHCNMIIIFIGLVKLL